MHSRVLLEPIPDTRGYRYIFPVYLSDNGSVIGIRLRKFDIGAFIREDPYHLVEADLDLCYSVPRTRCLLMALPTQHNSLRYHIIPIRRNLLQICLPQDLEIGDVWPWTHWDDEDQVFFAPEESESGCGSARIKGCLSRRIGRQNITIRIECMFYALGWSQEEDTRIQCTIIDLRSLDTAVNEIKARMTEYDQESPEVRENLVYYKIPKQSSVAFEVPQRGMRLVVSFTTERVTDPRLCEVGFWPVVFKWKFCKVEELPVIHDREWKKKKKTQDKHQKNPATTSYFLVGLLFFFFNEPERPPEYPSPSESRTH